MKARAWTLALAVFVGGCAHQAPLPPPPAAAPAHFKEDAVWRRAAGVSSATAAAVPERWWTLFDDRALDALEERLAIDNAGLAAAAARVAQARAALRASQANQMPTLGVGASAGRGRSSGSTANAFSLQADASWELDLWGRLSMATQAAGAQVQASADDLAAARLSAQATLAQAWFGWRTAVAQGALLARTEAALERALQLTQARRDAGVVAESDVLQAQTQLKSVQAQRADSGLQQALLEHVIAALVGRAPSEAAAPTFAATGQALPEPPATPELLPSTLLERRPDIAAAERRVAAAWAQIGVAQAAYFPNITLTAGAALRGAALSGLASAPALAWSLGAALAQAVFDGGAHRAAEDQARALADEAAASYRQAVLAAFQEVEDNLAALAVLADEEQLQQQALQAAQRSVEISLAQYRAGTVGYLNVVSAQTAALSAEASVLALHNRRLAAASVLLKNIGGRWAPA